MSVPGCCRIPSLFFQRVTAENSSSESISIRWKRTSQQKEKLKNIYRNGMQSPPLDEIERITSLLKNYGRVEQKNVKCWFQKFKSRKSKRALESPFSLGGEEFLLFTIGKSPLQLIRLVISSIFFLFYATV